jgi:hypothetical protein
LFRYLDEQRFRYNNRKDLDDAGRLEMVVSQLLGKRLTFAELTGKVGSVTATVASILSMGIRSTTKRSCF